MRKISALTGFVMAIGILFATLFHSGADVALFVNLMGVFIVVGGTISAIFLSYSFDEVAKLVNIISAIFLKEDKKFNAVAKELLDFSQKCLVSGIPSEKPKVVHPFLDDCIMMLNENYEEAEIRKVLEQRINSMYDSETYDMTMLRSMAKYPPAFGMIGTVIGLIALMSSIGGESEGANNIGSYMAIALTTTLYGLVLSNFLFKPISDNLENSSMHKLKVRSMIMEVCIQIKAKRPLVVIQDTINSMIPPKHAIEDGYFEEVMKRAS